MARCCMSLLVLFRPDCLFESDTVFQRACLFDWQDKSQPPEFVISIASLNLNFTHPKEVPWIYF